MRHMVTSCCFLLAVVRRIVGQSFIIGNDLPCQGLDNPDLNNPQDNFSCPTANQSILQCFSREQLYNNIEDCAGGVDEGTDVDSLECSKFV